MIKLLPLIFLVGCTPYIGVRHVDHTPFQGGNDAWDLACLGAKKKGQLQLKAGWCANIRGGDMIEISAEYDLID